MCPERGWPEPPGDHALRAALQPSNITATALTATHDDGTVVAPGCDDEAEFELALGLMLDGFERLRVADGTRSTDALTGLLTH